jgi:hypothetical protein
MPPVAPRHHDRHTFDQRPLLIVVIPVEEVEEFIDGREVLVEVSECGHDLSPRPACAASRCRTGMPSHRKKARY